jgi:hypothetical protein
MKFLIILIVIVGVALGNICGEMDAEITILNEEVSDYLGGIPTSPASNFFQQPKREMDEAKKKLMDPNHILKKIENSVIYIKGSFIEYTFNYVYSKLECQPNSKCVLDLITLSADDYSFKFYRFFIYITGTQVSNCKLSIEKQLDSNMSTKMLDLEQVYPTFEIRMEKLKETKYKDLHENEKTHIKKEKVLEFIFNTENRLFGNPNVKREIVGDKPEDLVASSDNWVEGGIRLVSSSRKIVEEKYVVTSSYEFTIDGVVTSFEDVGSYYYPLFRLIQNLIELPKDCPSEYKYYDYRFKSETYIPYIEKFKALINNGDGTGVLKFVGQTNVEISGRIITYTFKPRFSPIWDSKRKLVLEELRDNNKYEHTLLVGFPNEKCIPGMSKKKLLRRKK